MFLLPYSIWVSCSPGFSLESIPIFISETYRLIVVTFAKDFLIYGLLCLNIIVSLLIGLWYLKFLS